MTDWFTLHKTFLKYTSKTKYIIKESVDEGKINCDHEEEIAQRRHSFVTDKFFG